MFGFVAEALIWSTAGLLLFEVIEPNPAHVYIAAGLAISALHGRLARFSKENSE